MSLVCSFSFVYESLLISLVNSKQHESKKKRETSFTFCCCPFDPLTLRYNCLNRRNFWIITIIYIFFNEWMNVMCMVYAHEWARALRILKSKCIFFWFCSSFFFWLCLHQRTGYRKSLTKWSMFFFWNCWIFFWAINLSADLLKWINSWLCVTHCSYLWLTHKLLSIQMENCCKTKKKE